MVIPFFQSFELFFERTVLWFSRLFYSCSTVLTDLDRMVGIPVMAGLFLSNT